jgi:hypothetical protein
MLTSIHGIIDIAADASVAGSSIKGATVAKSGTGEYTVTLADKFNALMDVQLTVEAATPVDLVPQILSTDVSGTKEIVFSLLTGATPTDPSAVCKVHFKAFLRNSSVVK